MRRGGRVLLGAVGFAVMVVASAWAPLQPELITTGAACQMAPCGTLEDPVQGVATGAAVAPFVGLAVLGSWVRGSLGLRSGSPGERLRQERAR